jgi:hypothetical protein
MVGGAGAGAGAAAVGVRVGDGVLVAVPGGEILEGDGPDDVLPKPAMTAARTTPTTSRAANPAASHSRRRLSMTGRYHSRELKTPPRKPQFGHNKALAGGCGVSTKSASRSTMGFKSLRLHRTGFAASFPFRNGGLFAHGTGRLSLRAREEPAWPQCRGSAPNAGDGREPRAEVHREVQGTESPSNDAMVSGASKFPSRKRPVSTESLRNESYDCSSKTPSIAAPPGAHSIAPCPGIAARTQWRSRRGQRQVSSELDCPSRFRILRPGDPGNVLPAEEHLHQCR